MGSVCIILAIVDDIVIIIKIPAVYIVHIAVIIVIYAIARYLSFIYPEHILQIFMAVIYSRIDDSNYGFTPSTAVLCTSLRKAYVYTAYSLNACNRLLDKLTSNLLVVFKISSILHSPLVNEVFITKTHLVIKCLVYYFCSICIGKTLI